MNDDILLKIAASARQSIQAMAEDMGHPKDDVLFMGFRLEAKEHEEGAWLLSIAWAPRSGTALSAITTGGSIDLELTMGTTDPAEVLRLLTKRAKKQKPAER